MEDAGWQFVGYAHVKKTAAVVFSGRMESMNMGREAACWVLFGLSHMNSAHQWKPSEEGLQGEVIVVAVLTRSQLVFWSFYSNDIRRSGSLPSMSVIRM